MFNPRGSERRARYQKRLNRNQVDGSVRQATTFQLKRLYAYIKPYTSKMVFGLIGMFAATGIGLVVPMIVQRLVDTLFSSTHLRPILNITIYLLVLFLIRAIFNFIEGYYLSYIGEKIILDIIKAYHVEFTIQTNLNVM